jgi:hypothetical protein
MKQEDNCGDHLNELIAENIQARALLSDAASYCHAAWILYDSGEGKQMAEKIREFIETTKVVS